MLLELCRNRTLDLLMADAPVLDYYRATDHGCNLQRIGDLFVDDSYAIGMKKGFPLRDSISALIAKYASNGYLDILTEKWYGGLPCFKFEADIVQPRPLGKCYSVFVGICIYGRFYSVVFTFYEIKRKIEIVYGLQVEKIIINYNNTTLTTCSNYKVGQLYRVYFQKCVECKHSHLYWSLLCVHSLHFHVCCSEISTHNKNCMIYDTIIVNNT